MPVRAGWPVRAGRPERFRTEGPGEYCYINITLQLWANEEKSNLPGTFVSLLLKQPIKCACILNSFTIQAKPNDVFGSPSPKERFHTVRFGVHTSIRYYSPT